MKGLPGVEGTENEDRSWEEGLRSRVEGGQIPTQEEKSTQKGEGRIHSLGNADEHSKDGHDGIRLGKSTAH